MAKAKKSKSGSPCVQVAKGGVGESGASSQVHHWLEDAKTSKLMVLETTGSSLCPNTGAAAMLIVDGAVAASGVISGPGSSIQAEARPGDRVVGIVHTFPLFNEVHCIRLGELSFSLEECDLVASAAASTATTRTVLSGDPAPTRDWYAWVNLMPPGPATLHVTGEVEVGSPGVEVMLVPCRPRGKSKKTLDLELVRVQLPGFWPQVVVWKPVRYDKTLTAGLTYKTVDVWEGEEKVASVPIEEVH